MPIPGVRRLAIISDAHHYRDAEGRLCTLTPVARQFEQWAEMFEEVVVCAPLLQGPPAAVHTPYRAANISLEPIPNAGGNTLGAKLHLVARLPAWRRALRGVLARVDAVHVRCPNNVSIVGLLLLSGTPHLRQAVYTGNWRGYPGEPPTYRWQRWFLRTRFRGPVAVYGDAAGEPEHVVPTFSPAFARADWEHEGPQVERRTARLRAGAPAEGAMRMLTVGGLDRNKNQRTAIRALALLRDRGVAAELDVVGDGPGGDALRRLARELAVDERVRFHGRMSHADVRAHYRAADFVVQPSYTEGFSKVVVEAMLHGAVPLISDLPVNRAIADGGRRARCFAPDDAGALADHAAALWAAPAERAAMVEAGREYTRGLTLESWREHIRGMLLSHWRPRPADRR